MALGIRLHTSGDTFDCNLPPPGRRFERNRHTGQEGSKKCGYRIRSGIRAAVTGWFIDRPSVTGAVDPYRVTTAARNGMNLSFAQLCNSEFRTERGLRTADCGLRIGIFNFER
jgi:hypothetical protein